MYENNSKLEEIDKFLEKYDFLRCDTEICDKLWGYAFYMKKSEIAKLEFL